MELIISKDEVEELIEEKFNEGDITKEEKKEALNDLKLGDYQEWIENDFIIVQFEYSGVSVTQYLGQTNDNMSIFVR